MSLFSIGGASLILSRSILYTILFVMFSMGVSVRPVVLSVIDLFTLSDSMLL